MRDDAASRAPGREFVIVIVILFSSLSFVLGYYVGRNGRPIETGSVPQAAQPQQMQPVPEAPAQQPPPETTEKTETAVEPPVKPRPKPSETAQVVSEISIEPSGKADKTSREVEAGLAPAKKKEAGKPERAPSEAKDKTGDGGQVYTVQLAVLKKEAEAEIFRVKYKKKGYKTYISAAKGKKNEKIYKVRAGEFKDKKSAEALAEKLRKREGLKTFVTLKNK